MYHFWHVYTLQTFWLGENVFLRDSQRYPLKESIYPVLWPNVSVHPYRETHSGFHPGNEALFSKGRAGQIFRWTTAIFSQPDRLVVGEGKAGGKDAVAGVVVMDPSASLRLPILLSKHLSSWELGCLQQKQTIRSHLRWWRKPLSCSRILSVSRRGEKAWRETEITANQRFSERWSRLRLMWIRKVGY